MEQREKNHLGSICLEYRYNLTTIHRIIKSLKINSKNKQDTQDRPSAIKVQLYLMIAEICIIDPAVFCERSLPRFSISHRSRWKDPARNLSLQHTYDYPAVEAARNGSIDGHYDLSKREGREGGGEERSKKGEK